MMAGIFSGEFQPERGKMAVEEAGIEALIAGDRVTLVPLVRDRVKTGW